MPFLRISVPAGRGRGFKKQVGDAVHDAMVAAINIPCEDRFQIITEHAPDQLLFDRSYLGVDRSDNCVFIQLTMKGGRTPAQKKALFATMANNLQNRVGLRKQDVMVILSENEPIDWSFGNGEAQLADH